MATKIGNTAAGPVMLRPDKLDKYSPTNLLLYRISLALMRNLTDNGVFTKAEYCEIRTILNKKYGLPSGSIFAEAA